MGYRRVVMRAALRYHRAQPRSCARRRVYRNNARMFRAVWRGYRNSCHAAAHILMPQQRRVRDRCRPRGSSVALPMHNTAVTAARVAVHDILPFTYKTVVFAQHVPLALPRHQTTRSLLVHARYCHTSLVAAPVTHNAFLHHFRFFSHRQQCRSSL